MYSDLEALEMSLELAPHDLPSNVMKYLGLVAVAEWKPSRDHRIPVAAAAVVATAAAGTVVLVKLYPVPGYTSDEGYIYSQAGT